MERLTPANFDISETEISLTSIEDVVVSGYQKIEDTVVGGYKKIEDSVVGSYKKIEDKFVDTFLNNDKEENNK